VGRGEWITLHICFCVGRKEVKARQEAMLMLVTTSR
jgi:hypothetical protein